MADADARMAAVIAGKPRRSPLARLLMSLPAAAVSVLFSAAPAHADLKLCNRMSYVVETAIGIDDKAATATRGWFRIDPATCRVVVQGALTADRVLLNARALGVYEQRWSAPTGPLVSLACWPEEISTAGPEPFL